MKNEKLEMKNRKSNVVGADPCVRPMCIPPELILYSDIKKVIIRAPAKLNLFLKVIRKKQDGYHAIDTIFERIDLCDTLTMHACAGKAVRLTGDGPPGKDNLVYKAVKLLQQHVGITHGVHIHLQKAIPMGAGLGGGSSDAASSLLGYIHLYQLSISRTMLFECAYKIGSDVAFFLSGACFARGLDRGQQLKKITSKRILYHVLVYPRIAVATPAVYHAWDVLGKTHLTEKMVDVKLFLHSLLYKNIRSLKEKAYNNLLPAAFMCNKRLLQIQRSLIHISQEPFFLSGSGSTFFSLHAREEEAVRVYKMIVRHPHWKCYLAKTW